jgi:hypothetical protein
MNDLEKRRKCIAKIQNKKERKKERKKECMSAINEYI